MGETAVKNSAETRQEVHFRYRPNKSNQPYW